jgi:hypothetical protein
MQESKPDMLITTLINHLKGGTAFLPIEQILEDVSFHQAGLQFPQLPYTFYQLFEHMRKAQKDILDYCTDTHYAELKWPEDYWPENTAPADAQNWQIIKAKFFKERQELVQLLSESHNSIFEPLANGPKHHLFREVLLIIEHNAYHTGQLMVIKRLLTPIQLNS